MVRLCVEFVIKTAKANVTCDLQNKNKGCVLGLNLLGLSVAQAQEEKKGIKRVRLCVAILG